MPVYQNPNFLRLSDGLAGLFEGVAEDSFFALPAWYDLMARHGVPTGSEIRVYTDERPGSAMPTLSQRGRSARISDRIAANPAARSVPGRKTMLCSTL